MSNNVCAETVVAPAWLTFAEGTVYEAYDTPVRVWGMSITADQQLAGAIMKTGGALFLWSIIIFLFFKRFAAGYLTDNTYRRDAVESVADADAVLTTEDIEREFATTPAPRED